MLQARERPVNIASALVDMAASRPDGAAIVCPWGRRGGELSYAQLDRRSTAVARGLATYGIGRGTRTALMVRPGLDLFVLVFGLFKAGAVPVLVDPGIGLRHLKRSLDRAAPEAFIGVPTAHMARIALGWARSSLRRLVTVGVRLGWGGTDLASLEEVGAGEGGFEIVSDGADELAAIVFTSGSTGPPKGVVYRHGNFLAQIEAIRQALGIEPGEVDLPTFPLFALFDPALGMTTIVPDMDPTRPARVRPQNVIGPIHEYGVTNMFGSPALLDTVSRWGAPRGVTLPSLRRVLSAGAPVPPRVIERFSQMLPAGAQIFTPYGATEALPVAVIGSAEILGDTRRASETGSGTCVGRPVPSVDVTIIATDDRPIASWSDAHIVAPSEIGEIIVSGPQVTREYWQAPEHDRRGKIADGTVIRHRMGDLGWMDDRGRLWFCGRKAHRVVTSRGPMYTVPCEAVFNTHAAVHRSALVGVEISGSVEPVLVVEKDPLAARIGTARLVSELLDMAGRFQHTASIQKILFCRRLPVDIRHNSKIDRARLARWAARKLGGAPSVVGS